MALLGPNTKHGARRSSPLLSAEPQDTQKRVWPIRMQVLSDAKHLIAVAKDPGAKS